MKAVVMEINGRKAIVLSKEGQFLKIRNKDGLNIGCEVDLENMGRTSLHMLKKAGAAAAVFVVTAGLGTGVYGYFTPYSYINVDINPSIEITANRFDRVLKVEAKNEDGAIILENKNFRYNTINNTVEEMIKSSAEKGYLKKDDGDAVMLTVAGKSEKKIEQVEKKVFEAVKGETSSEGFQTEVIVEKVTPRQQEEAKALDISPGKLVLMEKLQEADPQVKVEEVKDTPVRDIMKAIKEKTKLQKAEKKQVEDREKEKEQNQNSDRGKDWVNSAAGTVKSNNGKVNGTNNKNDDKNIDRFENEIENRLNGIFGEKKDNKQEKGQQKEQQKEEKKETNSNANSLWNNGWNNSWNNSWDKNEGEARNKDGNSSVNKGNSNSKNDDSDKNGRNSQNSGGSEIKNEDKKDSWDWNISRDQGNGFRKEPSKNSNKKEENSSKNNSVGKNENKNGRRP